MHRVSSRRAFLHALLVTTFVLSLFVGQRGLIPAVAQASTPTTTSATLAATACENAALNDIWRVDMTASYKRSDSLGQFKSEVDQSGSVTITYNQQLNDETHAVWTASEATGTGHIYGKDTTERYQQDPEINIFQGDGAPIDAGGRMVLNKATCTYTLWGYVHIKTTSQYDNGKPSDHVDQPLSFEVVNRPIPTQPGTGTLAPTLSGNTSIEVYTNNEPDGPHDTFNRASAGEGVTTIAANKNMSAGSATVSWAAHPNTVAPQITDISFKQPDYPSGTLNAVGQKGTVDGNFVTIFATLKNPLTTGFQSTIHFLDAETNTELPNCSYPIGIAPASQIDVNCQWDTEGWAWDSAANGNPPVQHANHRIKAVLGDLNAPVDTREKPIIVRPKPVILVHGLNSNDQGWGKYSGFLHAANDNWTAYAVPGLKTGNDVVQQESSRTLLENAQTMHTYIQGVRALETAWHVDIVAHSMGGLISRQYIQTFMPKDTQDGRPVAAHLVMLGTPNQGSQCATVQFYLALLHRLPNIIAPAQLIPEVVAIFNKQVTNQKNTRFSVLAGYTSAYICDPFETEQNDLVVTISSARYIYSDFGFTKSTHIEMTGSQNDFIDWVLPHLAVGRVTTQALGAQPESNLSLSATTAPTPTLQFVQTIDQTIGANASATIPVTITQASAASIVFFAAPGSTVDLLNPAGQVVASSAPTTTLTIQVPRGFGVKSPTPGLWKINVTSLTPIPTPFIGTVLLAGSPLQLTAFTQPVPNQDQLTLTTTLTLSGTALTTATIQARIVRTDNTATDVTLLDDGQHGDGAAGDGVFGITLDNKTTLLAASISAQGNGETRSTVASLISVNAPNSQKVYVPLLRR